MKKLKTANQAYKRVKQSQKDTNYSEIEEIISIIEDSIKKTKFIASIDHHISEYNKKILIDKGYEVEFYHNPYQSENWTEISWKYLNL